MCSSDIIAAVSLVKYAKYPRIFSLLLGEGLWNDAVAVVLSDTMRKFVEQQDTPSWKSPFQIAGDFLLLSLLSSLIGIFFGVLSGLMTKHARFMVHSTAQESFFLFMLGFASYYSADAFG